MKFVEKIGTAEFDSSLGDPGSILGRNSTQGLKILRRKSYLYINISKMVRL